MRGLACDATTEAGADEIYILVAGVSSSGERYSARLPGPNAHWDMNDGDQPTDNPSGDSHMITNKTLFADSIDDGETWSVVVMIMEEDGGTTATAQQLAAAILGSTENPYAVAAGALLGVLTRLGFYRTDTDDYIGSFGVKITRNGDQINVDWRAIDRVSGEIANIDGRGSYGHEFRMNGDGSNYVGWYHFEKG